MHDDNPRKHLVSECPICGSKRFRYLFSVQEHRLVGCVECEFALLNPQPGDDELPAFGSARPFVVPPGAAEECVALFTRYAGPRRGRLLVLGPGAAAVAVPAALAGFSVTALLPHDAARQTLIEAAASAGATIDARIHAIDTLETIVGFDACIIAHGIEQARKPRSVVQDVFDRLRPGGLLLVATPTTASTTSRVHAMPLHVSYFNRKTLEGLLFSEGFRQLAYEPDFPTLDTATAAAGRSYVPFKTQASGASRDLVVMAQRAERRDRPRLSIIVPAYNEAATFATAFERLLRHPISGCDVEYLVVESNSTDGTRAIVQRFEGRPNVRILLEDRPRGKGHAVRTALAAATGDFILIQDADLEYDLEDYDALLEPLLTHREAFVLGARHGGRAWKMRQFSGQPITSMLLNFGHWLFTWLINVSCSVRLKDPFTMYKVFRRDCIHGLALEANRFDFDWELVIKLIRRGYVPREIPVNYRSRSFKEGKKVSVLRDPLTWIRALVRFRLERIPPWSPAAPLPDKASIPTAPLSL